MIKKWIRESRLLLVSFIVVGSIHLHAQEARESSVSKPETDVESAPEVIVTATRSPQSSKTSSSTVTTISRKEIENKKLQTVNQALRSVPGLALASNGTRGQATGVFTRGTNTNHTQVMIDGRRLPQDLAGAFDLGNLSLDNIERIEIVRGPSSSLYGSNTMGGVINLISKDGRGLEKPESSVEVEAGTFRTFRETAASRGAFGLFDYSVEATKMDTDFQRGNNEYRWSSIRGKVGHQTTPDLYVDTRVDYSLSDASNPGAIRGFGSPTPYDNVLNEKWSLSPGARWKTNEKWTQKLFYSHSQLRQVDVSPSGPSASRTQGDREQIDYQSDIRAADPLLVSVGGAFDNSRHWQFNDLTGRTSYRNTHTNVGGFIQTQWDITEAWKLENSARIDHMSDFGNPVTWRSGTSYAFDATKTVFRSSAGSAYSVPSEQNYMTFGGFQVPNHNLQPEESLGYDVGVDQSLFNETVELSATWFHNDIDSVIQTVTVMPGVSSTSVNSGEATTEGLEFGMTWKPVKSFSIVNSYTYLTAINEQTKLRLVRRPRHMWTADAIWQPIQALKISLGSRYVLDREDTDAVTFARTDAENYFIMHAVIVWDVHENVQLFARLENLTDEQYEEVNGFPALDRALYAGAKIKF